jgi:hypothetical protein
MSSLGVGDDQDRSWVSGEFGVYAFAAGQTSSDVVDNDERNRFNSDVLADT